MSTLQQKILGIEFNSPIVVASGPLTDSVDKIKEAEENGAGAVSSKLTLLRQPIKGHRRMYAVRGQYNFNPSDKRNDFEEGVELVRKAREAVSIPIFANIAGPGDDLEGWIKIGKAMEEVGADALELNFCCPNMAFSTDAKTGEKVGVMINRSPEIIGRITAAMHGAMKIPVFVKASGTNVEHMVFAKAIEKAGAEGITINGAQLAAPPLDIYNRGKTIMSNLGNNSLGALVGPAVRLHSNRMICNAARGTKLTIAGGGGISTWEHMVETMMYGASLTEICSKFLWDGFGGIKDMNASLLRFMEDQGYETLADLRGLALPNIVMSDQLYVHDSYPEIDAGKCSGCGSCAKIGSCDALSMNGKTVVLDAEKCSCCGLCGSLCPRRAISFAPVPARV